MIKVKLIYLGEEFDMPEMRLLCCVTRRKNRIGNDSNNAVFIGPSISTEWTSWSRFVSISTPIEIRDENDLLKLANLKKRLLKHEISLKKEFPAAFYRSNSVENRYVRKLAFD